MGDMEDLENDLTTEQDHPLAQQALQDGTMPPEFVRVRRLARVVRGLVNRGKQLEDRVAALEQRVGR